MPTKKLPGTVHYFVTDTIRYPQPPSEICASARNQLPSIIGLTSQAYNILFGMMLEIEGAVRGGTDDWIGFSAGSFSRDQLVTVRRLVDEHKLIRDVVVSDDSHDHTVVYFLSPAVLA